MKHFAIIVAVAAAMSMSVVAYPKGRNVLLETDSIFFTTPEASRIGTQVVAYQRDTGGWPKNVDMAKYLTAEELAEVIRQKSRRNDSTTDNFATTTQIKYLARLYKATGDTMWRDAAVRGVEYLLAGQYPNGGWPQFWPGQRDYQVHITYNDDAMVNTMTLIRDARDGVEPFDCAGLVDDSLRMRLDEAFKKGVECILATQIVVDGEPTVWCQQHDRETLAPASARAYELPSFASTESMAIVWMLMDIPNPDERVCRAIEGAMRWFDRTKISGYRYERRGPQGTRLVPDAGSTVWARYYDLVDCEPFVCDRDGIPRRSLDEIGKERRDGYAWYSSAPLCLYPKYEKWKLMHNS